MPPKKKQPKGPFFFFMLEIKRQYEQQGRRFPNGITDVKDLASPLWEKLSSEEKAVYKKQADEEKARGPTGVYERYDSLGKPISQKLQAINQAEARKKKMYEDIANEVKFLRETKGLAQHYFYFGHLNYTVVTDEKEYYPREIGLVKFSLGEGIVDHYHQFIDPGELRLGYSYSAKEHSMKTHQIPSYGFELATNDYHQVVAEILSFIRQRDGLLAPIYLEISGFEGYETMLNFLVDRCPAEIPNVGEPNGIQVRHLNKLFCELRKQARPEDSFYAFPSITYAGEVLWKKEFDYFPELACEWHGETDATQHCSLSIARRFAFFVADFCCPGYNIERKPGKHFPADMMLLPVETEESAPELQPQWETAGKNPRKPVAPSASTSRIAARFASLANNPPPSAAAQPSGVAGLGRGALKMAQVPRTPGSPSNSTGERESPNSLANGFRDLNLNSGASAQGPKMPLGRGRGRF